MMRYGLVGIGAEQRGGSRPASAMAPKQGRVLSSGAVSSHLVDISDDRSHQQCGLGAVSPADLPIVQRSEWDGSLGPGMRVAYRRDYFDKGGNIMHDWQMGSVKRVETGGELGNTLKSEIEFFNRAVCNDMDAAARASTKVVFLEKAKFGDGTHLEHNWFIVVVRRDYLETQTKVAQQAHAAFRERCSRYVGTAISNGQCGASSLAQFRYGTESPQTMRQVRLDIAGSLKAHTKKIAGIVAGSTLETGPIEAELLARVQMHERNNTSRPCPQSDWIGGLNGADFIAASLVPSYPPIYYCRENYTGGTIYHRGELQNFDIRNISELPDDAAVVCSVWNGVHFIPYLHRRALSLSPILPGAAEAPCIARPLRSSRQLCYTAKNMKWPSQSSNSYAALVDDEDSDDETTGPSPGSKSIDDGMHRRRALLLRELASKAQLTEQYRIIQDKLIEFGERKKQGRWGLIYFLLVLDAAATAPFPTATCTIWPVVRFNLWITAKRNVLRAAIENLSAGVLMSAENRRFVFEFPDVRARGDLSKVDFQAMEEWAQVRTNRIKFRPHELVTPAAVSVARRKFWHCEKTNRGERARRWW